VARSFTTATDRVTFGTLGTFAWTFGTWGAVFYTVTTGNYRFCLGLGHTTVEDSSLGMGDYDGPFYYDGGSHFAHASSFSFAAGSWAMLICTKETGTVAPVAHSYRWTNNLWVHETMDDTNANNTASSDRVIVGNHHNDGSDHKSILSHMAAAFMLPSRVMSNSEIQRLPEGNWDLLIPTAERWEWASGRDQPSTSNLMRSWGPNNLRATAVTGTARSAVRDPPGFRFSRNTRRR
jgi:hypothetical protein